MSEPPQTPPLAGLVVGVTADRRADEQMELLARRGARVVHAPTIRTIPLAGERELRDATAALVARPPEVVVLTTGLGVRSWIEAAASFGLGEQLTEAVNAAMVVARGPKAVGAAVTAGWRVDWSAPTAESVQVVEHLKASGLSGRRVAVQVDGRSEPVLAHEVARLDADVVAVPVYRWELADDVDRVERMIGSVIDGAIDAVTFTSAPAVWNLATVAQSAGVGDELGRALSSTALAVSVGPVCTRALRDAGYSNVVEPERARLGSMVRALTHHVERHRATVVVGDREVVLAASAVVVDGTVLALAGRERDLLGALLRKPGAVVAKQDLLREVWGGAADMHAVEVTVGRLRRRLAGVLDVEAVPRRGYRIATHDAIAHAMRGRQ